MLLLRIILFLLPLPLIACNSAAPPPTARFDASEAAFLDKPGKAKISGQAFLPDKTGHTNVRYAAGEVVRLIPATSYAKERLDYYFHGAKFAPATAIPKNDPDPDYVAHAYDKGWADGALRIRECAAGPLLCLDAGDLEAGPSLPAGGRPDI